VGAFGSDAIAAAEAAGTARQTRRRPIGEVRALQRAGVTILDIREPDEWEAGHLDGVENRPLGRLARSLAGMDRDTPIALHCEGGTRSAIGAALLEQLGFTKVTDLTGGWRAWTDGGGPPPTGGR
jgi:rhodanese-related sulfurtransferase